MHWWLIERFQLNGQEGKEEERRERRQTNFLQRSIFAILLLQIALQKLFCLLTNELSDQTQGDNRRI
jgi:hypothetical protein